MGAATIISLVISAVSKLGLMDMLKQAIVAHELKQTGANEQATKDTASDLKAVEAERDAATKRVAAQDALAKGDF